MSQILSWIVLLPAVVGIGILCLPKSWEEKSREIAVFTSLIVAALAIWASQHFDAKAAEALQFHVKYEWIPMLGIHYELGLDGMNLPLVVMTAVLTPLAFIGTWTQTQASATMQKRMAALVLFMETGALGTFLAQDLFLFYIFWEVILVPAYLLVGMYGDKDRFKATLQFFLYTFFGSILMLVGIAWLVHTQAQVTGQPSASFSALLNLKLPFDPAASFGGLATTQGVLFAAFAAAFFIKSPLVPFHGWLVATYRQAPTLVSIYLAAILSKMGTYGILKILIPLFPEAAHAFSPFLMSLAAFGIIYGALLAIVQKDFKTVVAYSSLSHVSYILLGLFSLKAEGMGGALLQMVNHGVAIAGLFLITGFLEKRRGSLLLKDFGGWAPQTPILATGFMVIVLSTVALPGSGGFVGEFAILVASFRVNGYITAFAATGMVLGAVYMLNIYQKTMFGKFVDSEAEKVSDLNAREIAVLTVLGLCIVGIGTAPQPFLAPSRTVIEESAKRISPEEELPARPTLPGQVSN
ncbi:MAG: NADH-quinone oxidoreductase subunit M [Proteobacteria bacterium]|nr:MAG: NADH-quinone oxidoreductase subunit M [Pseudomonadota bacterium]